MSNLNFYQVDCVYGSENQQDVAYVCETENGTFWYCVDSSENFNESTIKPFDGFSVESDVYDVDCFTSSPVYSLSQFENVMNEHLKPETVERAILTIEIESIHSAFQADNAQNELVRILKNCIEKIERQTFDSCKLKDVNGNNVGDFYLSIESEEV